MRRFTGEQGEVGGVCAGISYWLGIPTWVVRLAVFVAIFVYGVGFGAYILLWIFMPKWDREPSDYEEVAGD